MTYCGPSCSWFLLLIMRLISNRCFSNSSFNKVFQLPNCKKTFLSEFFCNSIEYEAFEDIFPIGRSIAHCAAIQKFQNDPVGSFFRAFLLLHFETEKKYLTRISWMISPCKNHMVICQRTFVDHARLIFQKGTQSQKA